MRPKQFAALLQSVIRHNQECGERNAHPLEYIRLGLSGEPGVGKSALVGAGGKPLGYTTSTFLASMKDPTELSGGMFADGRYCGWLRPRFLPEGDVKVVLLMDEMGQSPLHMQNACANMHLDRKAGDHEIGRFVTIVACYNPPKNRAGSTRLPSQYLNRLLQVELKPNVEDWVEWAQLAGLDGDLPSFMAWKGESALHDFDAQRDVNATPRAWETVNSVLGMKLPTMVETESLAGLVGVTLASAFNGFRRLKAEIGDINEVLRNPKGFPLSDKREVLFAILTVLQGAVKRPTLQAAFDFAARMPSKELEMFFVKSMIRKDERQVRLHKEDAAKHAAPLFVQQHPAYVEWLTRGNANLI